MPRRPKVDPQQQSLNFEDAAWRKSLPPKGKGRVKRLLAAPIADGVDDKGKRVSAWTIRLVLLAINSFGDECWASSETIGERCGDPDWQDWIPNGRRLADRTVKSAIQALYTLKPYELLDRMNKGKRSERRRILWQYVGRTRARQRRPMGELSSPIAAGPMGELAPEMGELVPAIGELAPEMGELVHPNSSLKNYSIQETSSYNSDALEEEVFSAGVDLASKAVAAALKAGCTAAEIRAAVSHFQRRPDLAGKPGTLFGKLVRMRPGEQPERGFPKAAKSGGYRQARAPADD